MKAYISRREFAIVTASALGSTAVVAAQEEKKTLPPASKGPVEAAFQRDYTAPSFKPSWKKEQINRQLVQDFVIFAHSDLGMVKQLLAKDPALVNSTMDWGGGDWESGLGGASHMGRRDIVEHLLNAGARIDIFCAAMLGMVDVVKAFITMQPKMIDARGPHGFTLHFHAQVGGKTSEPVLDYLQSVKRIEMKPNPMLNSKTGSPKK